MSAQKVTSRPRQVTTAGVLGVVGSVLLVLSLFDAVQRVRSVEMRSSVEEFLSEPPGNGLGVSADWVLQALHVMVLLNGALAAVTAVLAIYVIQRHHAARIGFTVAAALMLLTAPLSGGVMAMLVAFAATMLWGQPARDWFAGREPAGHARADRESSTPHPSWSAPERATDSSERAWPAPERGAVATAPAPEESATPPPATYPFGTRPDPHWAPPAEPSGRCSRSGADQLGCGVELSRSARAWPAGSRPANQSRAGWPHSIVAANATSMAITPPDSGAVSSMSAAATVKPIRAAWCRWMT